MIDFKNLKEVRDENTSNYIEKVFPYEKNTNWVVMEDASSGLIHVIDITTDFIKAYGIALHYIYCCECVAGEPYLLENEEGIGFACCDKTEFNSCANPDYVFILKYKNED